MIQKIANAALEGKLISKSIQFIFTKLLVILVRKADSAIGQVLRYFYTLTTKVQCNKIVFMTYRNDYDCNPKYIAEEILRQGMPWDLVWIVPKKGSMFQSHFPETIRRVRRDHMSAYREMATAKVWIDNSLNFIWTKGIKKKKEQIYIETWHGAMGIKRVGNNDVKNKYWLKRAQLCNKYTNFCISNSTFENDVYRTTHWSKTPVLLYGHPRNDCLFRQDKRLETRARLWEQYELETEARVVLYAPTFRDSGHIDCYNIDYKALTECLEKRFSGKWKVFLRMHFHDRKRKLNYESFPDCVIDVTKYPDMQELLMACDAGITDYSSWAYDYILTRRPMFIYATDVEQYNNERGFYFPLESTPFPIAKDNQELQQCIKNFDDVSYQKKIDIFLEERGCVEDGHAAERVVEKLKEIIGAEA